MHLYMSGSSIKGYALGTHFTRQTNSQLKRHVGVFKNLSLEYFMQEYERN